ncbi:hypothetical protein QYE76_071888 [Lolium multiflorum]|uniref:Peroxidase n=1 Tax=Lolium multiflorum TaxID=4521 RepID=A0AAD8SM68_LOLMU|nr:hypothetical protein QYE76_071888 [Lolium multiflorum]
MVKASLCVLVTLVLAVIAAQAQAVSPAKTTQAVMDAVVKQEVENAINCNPGVGAALVRLVFHDCWVRGCDASVLLDKTPSSSSVEKKAANNIGLAGFDVIDSIKARLHDVSCADIVVFAGRESARILSKGSIDYTLAPGRLDGVVSSAAEADATLPEASFSFQELKDNFNRTGFSVEDLVILSGAHSIGVAHRTSFQDRLDAATQTPIDPEYQTALRYRVNVDGHKTPNPTEKNNIRDMSPFFQGVSGYNSSGVNLYTPEAGALDNSYYTANLQKMVLFKSDWELNQDPTHFAGDKLIEYRDNAADWDLDFSDAMARLSSLTSSGPKSEVRKHCRRTNSY